MSDYLVAGAPGAPAVVVVHDWYGLLPHVRALVDDLASAGFSAMAVDLYNDHSTTDEHRAEELMEALDAATATQQLVEAVKRLRRDAEASRVSGVSFSMGGMLALQTAKSGLFDAIVAYYATASPSDVPLPCPLQLHLAGVDDFEPTDLPQQFAAAVRDTGGSAEEHVYPGTVHSFANADSLYYDEAAAALAWQRTHTFLGA